MNIFEYAIEMEKVGEDYYRRLANRTDNKGLTLILTMLADDEVKHRITIEQMQTGNTHMAETTVLIDAKNIFEKITESGEHFNFDIKQIEIYRKAQIIEESSRDFYLEKARQIEVEYQRELFGKLAEEESKHYFLLDNLIEFISAPDYFLENAEFNHLAEYC